MPTEKPAHVSLIKKQIEVQPVEAMPLILSAVVRRCLQIDAFKGKKLSDVVRELENSLTVTKE